MRVVSLDWETYYDTASGYTLKKMSTEDYVTDPRFEVICVSAQVDDDETEWFRLDEARLQLRLDDIQRAGGGV